MGWQLLCVLAAGQSRSLPGAGASQTPARCQSGYWELLEACKHTKSPVRPCWQNRPPPAGRRMCFPPTGMWAASRPNIQRGLTSQPDPTSRWDMCLLSDLQDLPLLPGLVPSSFQAPFFCPRALPFRTSLLSRPSVSQAQQSICRSALCDWLPSC